MFGDDGWYGWSASAWAQGARELYYWSMKRDDLERIGAGGWFGFLEGKQPDYPEQALRADFDVIRRKVEAMRADTTTPDTRLSDDPMPFNPATVRNLINLMLGAIHPGHRGQPLHARLRYFDPARRRSGIPEDVAALVEKLTDDETTVTLVNVSPVHHRTVIVQGGAYGEHECDEVTLNGKESSVDAPFFTVRLAPGAGARLVIKMKRYANPPALAQPWDRGWMLDG